MSLCSATYRIFGLELLNGGNLYCFSVYYVSICEHVTDVSVTDSEFTQKAISISKTSIEFLFLKINKSYL